MQSYLETWGALARYWQEHQSELIQDLFAADDKRFDHFSLQWSDMLLDFSKTTLTNESLELLLQLATSAQFESWREAMFAGHVVNLSERRPAWHIALRGNKDSQLPTEIFEMRSKMLAYVENCRHSQIYTDIVCIGIGGACLGPSMALAALAPYHDGPRVHFVSNMDSADLTDTLTLLNPQQTLVIISSKTFTTAETLANARLIRGWLSKTLDDRAVRERIVAVTVATEKAKEFGVSEIFSYWEWVGGRYSLWGVVGLPLALAIGATKFEDFLAGGNDMDEHFSTATASQNLPLILGLIGIWHRNICGYPTRAIIPYEQRLHQFPTYLQQLDMESNGKSIQQDGSLAMTKTAPVVWGGVGTNAQHSYFQMLHQGSDIVPCEYFAAACSHEKNNEQHQNLLANCLAQSAALAFGGESNSTLAHRQFVGNRPSVTILYKKLTPRVLGRLIALCEHRTFVEGTLWGVNPFDQWGVELGKTKAQELFFALKSDCVIDNQDSSTQGLLNYLRQQK